MAEDPVNPQALSTFREGDRVVIRGITGSGTLKKRLLEMGFTPGTPVHILKYAPLRDPLELKIKQSHLSIRVAEAKKLSAIPDVAPPTRGPGRQEGAAL